MSSSLASRINNAIRINIRLPNRRKFYIFDRIYCEIYHQLEPPHIYPIIACCLFITKSASMMNMLASVDVSIMSMLASVDMSIIIRLISVVMSIVIMLASIDVSIMIMLILVDISITI